MGGEAQDVEVLGIKATIQKLPFPVAQEMLPDVGDFLARAVKELGAALGSGIKGTDDVVKLLAVISPAEMRELLVLINKRASKILATTVVVMEGLSGDLENWEMGKEKHRNYVFGERPDLYVPLVIQAGMVTFRGFFPDPARLGVATPPPES